VTTTSPLLLGPLLRYVDATSASVWVEVAHRGVVTVALAGRTFDTPTFTVHGHHYALIDVAGLEPGASHPYTVSFDGQQIWPVADSPYPEPRIRTFHPDAPLRVVFGSCRTSVSHDAIGNLTHGPDVLRAYALRMARTEQSSWPTVLLLLGDQVYADETSAEMREYIAARRDIDEPPGEELKDYEEYAHLYSLAWTEPANRWLLSTLSSAMIFDDHDIRDDWNTSATWLRDIRATPWWHDRVVGGLASYWVYQHIGNLPPDERKADEVYAEVMRIGREGDAGEVLDRFVERADEEPAFYRWSFVRDFGATRLVMVDSRAARVLEEGHRRMLDDVEMAWLDDLLDGGHDHVLIGTSLPFLLPTGLHHLEAWNEAVCAGAWGSRMAARGEKLRQAVDLEHWAAFQTSFQDVARAVIEVADGRRGLAPATVTFLSGDVHHSYLATVDLGPGDRSRVLQAVCSPIRNPLPQAIRFATAAAAYGLAWPMGLLAARSARVPDPPFRWSITEGPWFDNVLATLFIEGRQARVVWESAEVEGGGDPTVVPLHSVTLA
jgi:PhoD-like phosphatase